MRTSEAEDELVRARLAYVSMGHRALNEPRRALRQEGSEDELSGGEAEEDESVLTTAPDRRRALSKLSRIQVLAALVVLATMAVLLTWSWMRSSATAIPAAQAEPSMPSQVISSSAPQPSASASPIRVHVLGAVQEPGVITVFEGAIVADAVEGAGGLASNARPGDLNLAAPVTAGMQIKVGSAIEASQVQGGNETSGVPDGSGAVSSIAGQLDLNTATAAQLDELPGIGPVIAQSIIEWRQEHGRFTAPEELQEISGIGAKTFAKLEPYVKV